MDEAAAGTTTGTVLRGRYRVGEVLGHGGMASVHHGTDLLLGREVALKLFRADATDPEELGRQQVEGRMLAKLNHHGLVTLFDVGTVLRGQREVPFLVMELVPGTDLRRHLSAGPMSWDETARLGAELAEALHYIHSHGVVHRDIKPANILLTRYAADAPWRPKLADFGIARMLDGVRLTATNMVPGTAAYLSPEQASGRPVGPAADIYSLGLVLLEALTGEVAFPGPPLESALARLSRPPAIPASVGPQWRSVLAAMTAPDPQDRPDAVQAAAMLRGASGQTVPVATVPIRTEPFQAVPAAVGPSEAQPHRLPALSPSQATNVTSLQPAPRPPSRRPVSAGADADRDKTLRRAGTRRLAVAAAAVLALVLAVLLVFSLQQPGPAPVETPQPAVPGQLGEDFRELEESVTP